MVYDTPTLIHDISGSYIEIVKRGALDSADLSDVRLLVGHDTSKIPLARTPKTMSLKLDDAGLTFEATLPNTEAGREAYQAVERGDLKGMSYAFTVPEGGDSYDPESNTRTINRIAKVYECSLTAFRLTSLLRSRQRVETHVFVSVVSWQRDRRRKSLLTRL